jgi:hypothetical protein
LQQVAVEEQTVLVVVVLVDIGQLLGLPLLLGQLLQ